MENKILDLIQEQIEQLKSSREFLWRSDFELIPNYKSFENTISIYDDAKAIFNSNDNPLIIEYSDEYQKTIYLLKNRLEFLISKKYYNIPDELLQLLETTKDVVNQFQNKDKVLLELKKEDPMFKFALKRLSVLENVVDRCFDNTETLTLASEIKMIESIEKNLILKK